jgi:uncharacterized protein YgbK (DUF1537 family)
VREGPDKKLPARVVGQILPGCSVVCCPSDHPRFPELPVVIFPGNVCDEQALAKAYRILLVCKVEPETM